jgi:hypothetical protein
MATKHPPGAQPPANLGGRPPALKPEHIAALHDIVTERAQASLEEIADAFFFQGLSKLRPRVVVVAHAHRGYTPRTLVLGGIHVMCPRPTCGA